MNTTQTAESPERWAERTLMEFANAMEFEVKNGVSGGLSLRINQLSAVKRQADACELWRAEALAALNALPDNKLVISKRWMDAMDARLSAGLE